MAKSGLAKQRQIKLGFAVLRAAEPTLPAIEAERVRAIVQAAADAPLRGGAKDLQHEGLFGDGMKQGRLF